MELKIRIVLETIKDAKKQVTEISDSVGPVPSTRETLKKVDTFLKEMEKEIVQTLPKEVRESKYKFLFSCMLLLMPLVKLLKELLAEAKLVIEQLLR